MFKLKDLITSNLFIVLCLLSKSTHNNAMDPQSLTSSIVPIIIVDFTDFANLINTHKNNSQETQPALASKIKKTVTIDTTEELRTTLNDIEALVTQLKSGPEANILKNISSDERENLERLLQEVEDAAQNALRVAQASERLLLELEVRDIFLKNLRNQNRLLETAKASMYLGIQNPSNGRLHKQLSALKIRKRSYSLEYGSIIAKTT